MYLLRTFRKKYPLNKNTAYIKFLNSHNMININVTRTLWKIWFISNLIILNKTELYWLLLSPGIQLTMIIQTYKERETERRKDRQTNWETDTQTDRQTDRETERQTDKPRDRETRRQKDSETGR